MSTSGFCTCTRSCKNAAITNETLAKNIPKHILCKGLKVNKSKHNPYSIPLYNTVEWSMTFSPQSKATLSHNRVNDSFKYWYKNEDEDGIESLKKHQKKIIYF